MMYLTPAKKLVPLKCSSKHPLPYSDAEILLLQTLVFVYFGPQESDLLGGHLEGVLRVCILLSH